MSEDKEENVVDEKPETLEKDNSQQPEQTTEQKLERAKAQVEGSKTEALSQKERADKAEEQNIKFAVQRVESDSKYMATLKEEDPEFADKVAKEFEGHETADSIINALNPSKKEEKSQEDIIAEKVLQTLGQNKVNESVDEKFSHLPEEQRKVATDKFKELKGSNTLSSEQASELAEMVTLHLQKDQLIENATANKIVSLGNLSLGGVSHTPATTENSGQELGKALGLKDVDKLYTNK